MLLYASAEADFWLFLSRACYYSGICAGVFIKKGLKFIAFLFGTYCAGYIPRTCSDRLTYLLLF